MNQKDTYHTVITTSTMVKIIIPSDKDAHDVAMFQNVVVRCYVSY